MEFDIHIECAKCEGYGVLEQTAHGVNANGPWVDFTEHDCDECDGSGLRHVGIETHDSLADVKDDYPESFVRNIETGERFFCIKGILSKCYTGLSILELLGGSVKSRRVPIRAM